LVEKCRKTDNIVVVVFPDAAHCQLKVEPVIHNWIAFLKLIKLMVFSIKFLFPIVNLGQAFARHPSRRTPE